MIPEDFDIVAFAKHLAESSENVFPTELPVELKTFTSNIIYNFAIICGNTLKKEENTYSKRQAIVICQLLAEWMYHKSIDIHKSEIPAEYREKILQKLAFTIFNQSKTDTLSGYDEHTIIQNTEQATNKCYTELVEELGKNNKLPNSIASTLKQSNLNDYVKNIMPNTTNCVAILNNTMSSSTTANNTDTQKQTEEYEIDIPATRKRLAIFMITIFIFIVAVLFVLAPQTKITAIDFQIKILLSAASCYGVYKARMHSILKTKDDTKMVAIDKSRCKLLWTLLITYILAIAIMYTFAHFNHINFININRIPIIGAMVCFIIYKVRMHFLKK